MTRRRRRIPDRGFDDALEACARSMAHGEVAIIHGRGCKGSVPEGCGCSIELVGPAVRVWAQ